MSTEKEMSFLDHLEELRWHVVRSFIAIIVSMLVIFAFGPWIFDNIIMAPGKPDFIFFKWLCKLGELTNATETLCVTDIPMKIQSRQLTGQFTMQVVFSFAMGFIIAFPYVFWEIWNFIKPGLHIKERSNSRAAVFYVSFLFLLGVAFGYFIMSPLSIWFLATYSLSDMVSNEFDITSYVSTLAMLVLGSGVLFQLPVVVFFLTKIGVMSPSLMRKNRKYATVIILVVSAVITPPDPLSMTLISIPLYILFEVSIFVSALEMKRRAKRERLRANEA